MNKEEALAQRCECGKYPIGWWFGFLPGGDQVVSATVSYPPGLFDPPMCEYHTKDGCFKPVRITQLVKGDG